MTAEVEHKPPPPVTECLAASAAWAERAAAAHNRHVFDAAGSAASIAQSYALLAIAQRPSDFPEVLTVERGDNGTTVVFAK